VVKERGKLAGWPAGKGDFLQTLLGGFVQSLRIAIQINLSAVQRAGLRKDHTIPRATARSSGVSMATGW